MVYNGMKHGYSVNFSDHVCLVNVDQVGGTVVWTMWNGQPVAKDYERGGKFMGVFARQSHRVHVFVYGGKVTRVLVLEMLRAWIGGAWHVEPLETPIGRPKTKK